MIKVAAVVALALSAAAADAQAPRVAVIRVSEIFNKLESTVRATAETNARKAEIDKDSRMVTYKELYADLELRKKALEENPPKIDAETRKRLAREYAVKLQEAKSLLEDFEGFRADRMREIETDAVEGMKQRLAVIQSTAEQMAKQEGYDWVLDASGNTNTGLPLLLYAKKAHDLTDRVLASLGPAQASPTTPSPAPAPAPSSRPSPSPRPTPKSQAPN
ncbi:OmpH family outer membrane protein [Luteolibacter soli]|uniref:OmpH family outer membrane protein n=1 Tax=Luteolibacter soli TaxID=3135280 RepID=A0ABU9B1C9_9BACT